MKKIVVSGIRFFMKFERHLEYFRERARSAGAEIVPVKTENEMEFQKSAEGASAIVVIARKISAQTIRRLECCEIILALSVGYDCIDVHAATEKGIPVSNVPAYCTDDVANHAMTLLLALSRKLPLLIQETTVGRWDYNPARPVFNYRDKLLGIVGLGKIGRSLLPKALGFGMSVAAYDPYLDDDIFKLMNVRRFHEFSDLLTESDYVSVHAPLTAETYHLFDQRVFDKMKETAYLINTARGSIIDQRALYDALTKRKIAGAGIDVLEKEPLEQDNPLLGLSNIIVTPHIAWYSEESFKNSMTQGMDEIVRILNGHRPRFIVNPEIFGMDKH